ncbi:hypothetical protein [Hoylesella timonensis]|uniref:hypothetical protein n=1 Tax=Hoylesella timonensis TaxID=386414 RepID=UPI00242CD45D|nr:hypothetical protein [Hoylesella timonensis]
MRPTKRIQCNKSMDNLRSANEAMPMGSFSKLNEIEALTHGDWRSNSWRLEA